MDDGLFVEGAFPGVPWTGESNKHRSFALSFEIPDDAAEDKPLLSKIVARSPLVEQACSVYAHAFSSAEFLLSPQEFKILAYVDWMRAVTEQGQSASQKKIKNPVTSNTFHVVALKGPLVLGVRFYYEDQELGCRMRGVVAKAEDQPGLRQKSRQQVEEAVQEFQGMKAQFDIPEPSNVYERGKKLRQHE